MPSKNLKQKNRIVLFDVLRIIAIFAVIWLHVSAGVWLEYAPTTKWCQVTVLLSLVRWSVPIFVMISGALFLDTNKKISIKKLYSKNILRIVIAYLFWSCAYAIRPNFTINQFIGLVIQGPFHFWFLKMLLGLYILIPIIRKITSDRKTEEYLLILAFLTAFVFPMYKILDIWNCELIWHFKYFIETVNIKMTLGFTGYFILGHYLYTYPIKKNIRTSVYILALISFFCVVMGTIHICNLLKCSNEILYENLNVFTLLESMAIFMFAKEHINKISLKHQNTITDLSNMSFGIYIVHVFIIKAADSNGINAYIFSPLLSIPIISLCVFIFSYLITKMISKIPYLNNYII